MRTVQERLGKNAILVKKKIHAFYQAKVTQNYQKNNKNIFDQFLLKNFFFC